MRTLVHVLLLSAAIAVATWVGGWWTVPIVAGVWTYASPRRGAVIYAAAAGALAWGALLMASGSAGYIGRVASLMGQIMNVPGAGFIALTLAYAALLAGAATLIVQTITGSRVSRST